MLIQADAAGLEIRVAAFLSQDPLLMEELWGNKDIHRDNQVRLKLPGWDIEDKNNNEYILGRLTAKTFVFRLLYGGGAYSYANDPDFNHISTSEKYWQEAIDNYYSKYKTIKQWHNSIIKAVVNNNGILKMSYGREYQFNKYNGSFKDTQIKNYPVQGLGADIMSIARVSAYNRIKKLGYGDKCLFVNTVHDSLILDVDEKVCDNNIIVETLHSVFEDVPKNFEKLFGIEFNVPMKAEVMAGNTWKDMVVVT